MTKLLDGSCVVVRFEQPCEEEEDGDYYRYYGIGDLERKPFDICFRRLYYKHRLPDVGIHVLEASHCYVELLDLFKGMDMSKEMRIQYFTLADSERPLYRLDGKTVEVLASGDEETIAPKGVRRRCRRVRDEWEAALEELTESENDHDSSSAPKDGGDDPDGVSGAEEDDDAVLDLFAPSDPPSIAGGGSSIVGGSGPPTPPDEVMSEGEFYDELDVDPNPPSTPSSSANRSDSGEGGSKHSSRSSSGTSRAKSSASSRHASRSGSPPPSREPPPRRQALEARRRHQYHCLFRRITAKLARESVQPTFYSCQLDTSFGMSTAMR